jgi:hypothetical protein
LHLIVGVPAVLVAVLPVLGANAGVAAWGTAGFVVAYVYARGRALGVKDVLGAAAVGVAVLGVSAIVDAGSDGPSHLGRLLGGQTDVLGLIERKVALNLGILTATPIVVLLPIALGAIAYLLVRPRGPLGAMVARERGLAAAVAGGVAAAVLAVVTEDSGVAVSALVMMMPACALAVAGLEPIEEAA